MQWVVGDVHGCLGPLERLLEAIRFDPATDELWSAGDLVNVGPHSAETLRLWRSLGGLGVLGNHDLYALRSFAGLRRRKGHDTLQALFDAPDATELIDWLGALPMLVRLESDAGRAVWLVHAGLHPRWNDLDATARVLNDRGAGAARWSSAEAVFATSVRCCDAAGRRSPHKGPPEECAAPFRPWDDFYRGELPVVHGHWAWRGYYRTARAIGLDSGCVYGRPLTAWCAEEDRIVQVPGQPVG